MLLTAFWLRRMAAILSTPPGTANSDHHLPVTQWYCVWTLSTNFRCPPPSRPWPLLIAAATIVHREQPRSSGNGNRNWNSSTSWTVGRAIRYGDPQTRVFYNIMHSNRLVYRRYVFSAHTRTLYVDAFVICLLYFLLVA